MTVNADSRRLTQRVEVPLDVVVDPWEWALALPYRAISDSSRSLVMPVSPNTFSDDYENREHRFRQACAYYTSLQSFLTYSFGWTRHDKGLLWWYSQNWPTEDERLALVKDIWFSDGSLTGYLAWVVSRMNSSPEASLIPLKQWAKRPDLAPATVPEEWAIKFSAALREGIWTGGYDPMHLWGGDHAGTPSGRANFGEHQETLTPARLVGVDMGSRTATFVAEKVDGWYKRLAELGGDLPKLPGDASWYVDVFVKPIGSLGIYRRSRETGLWFSGKHRYHSVGN